MSSIHASLPTQPHGLQLCSSPVIWINPEIQSPVHLSHFTVQVVLHPCSPGLADSQAYQHLGCVYPPTFGLEASGSLVHTIITYSL